MTKNAADERLADLSAQTGAHIRKVLHRSVRRGAHAFVRTKAGDLSKTYTFEVMEIGDMAFAVMLTLDPPTPAKLAQDVAKASLRLRMPVIVVVESMDATLRSRLVERGVAFVAPGNQLYIPQVGSDLRETFRPPMRPPRGGLTPVSQLVLFYCLTKNLDGVTPTQLASELGYTQMSLGRGFDELAVREVARIERRGREKILTLRGTPRDVLETCREHLLAPTRGVHAVRFAGAKPKMLKAGETALAALAGADIQAVPTFAIPATDWQDFFKDNGVDASVGLDEAEAVIETWRYDPKILSNGPCVDALSLYAQFWADPNPRLADAAAKLLDRFLAGGSPAQRKGK